jgi:lipase chaperone LimK
MKLKSSILWFGAALLGVAITAVVVLQPLTPETPPVAASIDGAKPFAFVRSMEGTQSDGNLKVNASNDLVVDAELGHLFDYYLSALGEKSLESIRVEIERELDRKLSPAAAAQAKILLNHYINYKRELVAIEKNLKPGTSLASGIRARLEAIKKTRAKFFSSTETAGLFGFTDTYDQDALARIEIDEDKTLNAEQKKAKIAQLDANLPPVLREAKEAPLRIAKVEEAVAQMRAKGGTDQDVYQFRSKAFSPEAATRLADLDREEDKWKARINTYLAARKQILQSNQEPTQQSAAIDALRQQQFSPEEQVRLPAYE